MRTSRLSACIVALVFLCASVGSLATGQGHQPHIKIERRNNNSKARNLLHILPLEAELQRLNDTLTAMAQVDEPLAHALLSKATQQVNNAAQLVAGPMVADKAYKVAKRRLQQILGTPALDTSGLANWLESGWQSQAQQLEANLASLQKSFSLPSLSTATQSIPGPKLPPGGNNSDLAKLLNATAYQYIVQNFIASVLDQAVTSQPGAMSGRRLQQQGSDAIGGAISTAAAPIANTIEALIASAEALNGPIEDIDVPMLLAMSDSGAASSRRLLADEGIQNIASNLQADAERALTSVRRLNEGANLVETARQDLSAGAAGLKKRFEKLQSRVEDLFKRSHRRLMADTPVPENQMPDSQSVMRPVTTATMVVLMGPQDVKENAAFVQDALGFLMEMLNTSYQPMSTASSSYDTTFGQPSFVRSTPAVEGFSADAQQEPPLPIASQRRLTSASKTVSNKKYTDIYGEYGHYDPYGYNLDAAYQDDMAWMWSSAGDEWATDKATVEEAIMAYAPDHPEETSVAELVIRLMTPSASGAVSPALINLVSDPEKTSLAALLDELSQSPPGSEIEVRNHAEELPRFAVFGPSAISDASQAGTAQTRPKGTQESGRVSEMVVVPMRGPAPHTGQSGPTAMDARWLGVVLGMGGLGLLLVGAALAAMRSPGTNQATPLGDGDSVYDGVRHRAHSEGATLLNASHDTPTSPWENKGMQKSSQSVDVQKPKQKTGGTPRKTSNLPA